MRKLTVLAILALVLLALAPSPAAAAEVRTGDTVVVGAGETIDDDLYAFGTSVTVLGRVNGDVVAAGSTVEIAGPVERSVTAAGGTVTVSGPVGGGVRVGGGTVGLSGAVGRDLLVGAGVARLGPAAHVGGDAILGGGTVALEGAIARRLWAGASDLAIGGPVGGAVRAEVGTLRLGPGAAIRGDLSYASDRAAEIAPGATVGGTTVRSLPRAGRAPTALPGPADAAVGWLRGLVGLAVFGVALVLLLPRWSERSSARVARSPWASLGLGLALLVGVPAGALLLFVFGLLVGGWWLGPLALALYALALVAGYALAALVVGTWGLARVLADEPHPAWRMVAGLVVLGLLTAVPVLGPLVALAAVLVGLGGLAIALARPTGAAGAATVAPAAPAPVALRPTG
jgi:hypothetical protein